MTITIQEALSQVLDMRDLTVAQMQAAMNTIMQGQATPAQIAGFIIALRMKGEAVDELVAAASVMRSLSNKVEVKVDNLVDTCGTGGDGQHTFNVSTTAAIVAASAGVNIAKHGNRSVSSNTGSADVLEELGVNLELAPDQIANCIEKTGIGFMFAPMHHSCMKHAIGPRKELGVRTLFNLLGPLTNPASAKNQILGVFNQRWLQPIANVLHRLGSEHALVVYAEDGLDEISAMSPTNVCEMHNGKIKQYMFAPGDLGIKPGNLADIKVENAQQSAEIIHQVLQGTEGTAMDIVALNAGAAIYVSGQAKSLAGGVKTAMECIHSGAANNKLDELVNFTNNL